MFLKLRFKKSSLNIIKRRFSTDLPHDNIIKHLNERGLISNISHPSVAESENIHSLLGKNIKLYIGFDPTAQSLHLGNLMGIMTALRFSSYGIDPIFLIGGATGLVGDPSGKSKERPLLSNETIQSNLENITNNLNYIVGNLSKNREFNKFNTLRLDSLKSSSSDEENFTKLVYRQQHLMEIEKLKNSGENGDNSRIDDIQNFETIMNTPIEGFRHKKVKPLVNYEIVDNYDFYKDFSVIDYLRKVGINMRMGSLLSKENVKTR